MKELKKAIKNLKKVLDLKDKEETLKSMNLFGAREINDKIDVEKINKIIKKLEEMI